MRCLCGLRVRQVAAGGMHSLALTEDGQVRWWWVEAVCCWMVQGQKRWG